MFARLLDWLKNPVEQVPEDIAICEFDCVEQECRLEDWEHCERRLHGGVTQSKNQPHSTC